VPSALLWKDMQGKADETERPRVWPGATVGSVKSEWESRISPALLRVRSMVGLRSICLRLNMPTDMRQEQH